MSVAGQLLDLKDVPLVVSDTGTVEVDDEGQLRLLTGSPAIATLFIDLNDPASFLAFDVEFLSQASGLLSFWIDGNSILSLDESLFDLQNGPVNTGLLPLPQELNAGIYHDCAT